MKLGHRPALDGLRGIAVLVVMAHHAYLPGFAGGAVGVDIFFVLSGFLITSLLWEEWRTWNDIRLRMFYFRRVLRLIPALALFLITVFGFAILQFRGPRLAIIEHSILAVIFYAANWVRAYNLIDMGPLAHTWSLSIEEQFYLLWPAALILSLRRFRGRQILWILIGLVVLLAVRRALLWEMGTSAARIYNGSDTRFDELLTGCALAVALYSGVFSLEAARRWLHVAIPISLLTIAAATVRQPPAGLMFTVGWPFIDLSVGALILGALAGSRMNRLLDLPLLVWVGKISYGLYLWHVPILSRAGGWSFFGHTLVGFALTFFAASLSYYLVEIRFLRLKGRLATGESAPVSVAA